MKKKNYKKMWKELYKFVKNERKEKFKNTKELATQLLICNETDDTKQITKDAMQMFGTYDGLNLIKSYMEFIEKEKRNNA